MTDNTSPLNRKALLVSVSIKYWGGQRGDARINEAVKDKYGTDVRAIHGRKRLLDQSNPKVAAVRKAKNQLRKTVYDQALSWEDGGPNGWRLLPAKNYWNFKDIIDQQSAAYEDAVAEMVREYPALLENARKTNAGLFDRGEFPGEHEMSTMYGVEVKYKEIPSGDDLRVNLGKDEEQHLREQIDADVRHAYNEAQLEAWQRLHDTVSHLTERLKAYEPDDKKASPFRDSTIQNVRDMVDTLERLNVSDDPKLEGVRQAVRDELATFDAKELRDDDATRANVADKADDILSKMDEYMSPNTATK